MERPICCYILLVLSFVTYVYSNGCENVFPGTPTFGRNCEFRCRCTNDQNCSESAGCINNRCQHGWMGPLCQYRNLAKDFAETAQEGENYIHHSDLAVDGNMNTCSETNLALHNGKQYWRVKLDRIYRTVAVKLNIMVNDLENFANFRIETGPSSSHFPNLCHEQRGKPETSVLEIVCSSPDETQNIRVTQLMDNVPLRICEFEIYGGREIAFNRPTSQSTTHGTWISTRAVDGRFPREGDEPVIETNTCARTSGQENNPFLYIDLQYNFNIRDMSFYGRQSEPAQSQGFTVAVGSSRNNVVEIFHDTVRNSTLTDYTPYQIVMSKEYAAKVVKIGMRPYIGTAVLSVCEMFVFGDCGRNKCGWNCEKDCFCDGDITGKMKIDGICPNGCSERWTGNNGACDTECLEDEWGELCNSKCGNCMELPCNIKTGQCVGGCSGPWLPPLCTLECKNGSYGVNCLETCGHCKDGSTCDLRTGQCQQGCKPGWQGDRCDKECPAQRFGKDCMQRCYCYDGVDCTKDLGECPGECSPGYHDKHCDKVCPFGFYGLSCAHVCGICRNNQTCDHVNGRCIGGCRPGYEGALCNHGYNLIEDIRSTVKTSMSSVDSGWDSKRAIDGDIGPDPNKCHCCSSTSNQAFAQWKIDLPRKYPLKTIEVYPRINEKYFQQTQNFNITLKNQTNDNGVVIQSHKVIEDTEAVIIDTRNTLAKIIEIQRVGKLTVCEIMAREGECPVGRYGEECNEFCHCADEKPCDRNTGICSTSVCNVGWMGKSCNLRCPAGFYGQHCALRCGFCKDKSACDHEKGICKNGCFEGYSGCFCTIKCTAGYYGQNCSYRCGLCNKNETCNAETGTCNNGCMTDYTEPYCKSKHERTSGSPHNLPHFLSWILISTMASIHLWDRIASFRFS